MEKALSDGTVSWLGGMDTSRDPSEIAQIQYSKANNIIIPDSLGGAKVRFGFHACLLEFDEEFTKKQYQEHPILAEGYFTSQGEVFLLAMCNGYILKFTKIRGRSYQVDNLNRYAQNSDTTSVGWITTIPSGAIIQNGFDDAILIKSNSFKRSNPSRDGIPIGRMGVYLQHRLFIVDQSSKQIFASDFNRPDKFTREGTNIFGFACPDQDERITAIAKQKSIVGNVEGGNLIWSSTKDIYSVDVRGTRTQWANLGSSVGKVSETVPGFSAASAYSFESFNTNIYFRSTQYGIADLKQSQYQFVELDSVNSQSIEASYYLNGDTDFMLSQCYSKSCNKRLFTTVAPERDSLGNIFWNGILSFYPSAVYAGQGSTPRRFESVFTGVRPWAMTCVKSQNKDQLFFHSHDGDLVNRLYEMDENTDYDTDIYGAVKEIEGFVETRAYTHQNPLIFKQSISRSYSLGYMDRTTSIILLSRPETTGPWTQFWDEDHLICRAKIDEGVLVPQSHKGQTRPNVTLSAEKFSDCYRYGTKFYGLQYRIEFKGPMNLRSIVTSATLEQGESSIYRAETQCETLVYSYRPDYSYQITPSWQ